MEHKNQIRLIIFWCGTSRQENLLVSFVVVRVPLFKDVTKKKYRKNSQTIELRVRARMLWAGGFIAHYSNNCSRRRLICFSYFYCKVLSIVIWSLDRWLINWRHGGCEKVNLPCGITRSRELMKIFLTIQDMSGLF